MAKTPTIAGNTFLFTGRLTEFTREDAEAHVEAEGGKVLSGVSAKLNYLVVGEDAGSKLKKAEALGTVTILHEKEFLKMMSSGKKAPTKAAPKKIVKVTPQKEKVNNKPSSDKTKKTKVFIGKKLLDVKTAKKSISDFVDLSEFDSIDPKAAAILAAEDSSLDLNGLKYLDVETAIALAKQEGENDLSLNGLEGLDVDVAKELAKHTGALNLNGLRSISPEVAKELAKCQFNIYLDGVEDLDDVSGFFSFQKLISFQGVKKISDNAAEQLKKFKDVLILKITSAELPDNVLSALSVFCPTFETLNLTAEQAKIIGKYSNGVTLNGLKNLSADIAKELVKVGSELTLLGVESISDEVAQILAGYKGQLTIGCKTLSEKSAQYLGEIKRNQEKNSLSLPNIDWSKVEGAGLDFFFIKGIWSMNKLKSGIELGDFPINFFNDYPKINFNVERVVKICYALAGGADYGLDLDETWFKEAVADGEEFQTFLEIGKMCQGGDWERFFPDSLKGNLDFFTSLAEICKDLPLEMLKLADKKILADKNLMMKFLETYQSIHSLLDIVDKKMQDDKEFVLKSVKKSKSNFQYASVRLRDDDDVVNALIQNEHYSFELQFVSPRFKSDEVFAERVLSESGNALKYFEKNIQSNASFVKTAIDNDSSAIEFASNDLKNNKEFLLALNRFNLSVLPKKLITDLTFLKQIIEKVYQNYLITENGLDSDEVELLRETFKKSPMEKELLAKVMMLSDDFVSDIPKEFESDLDIAKILIAKDVSNLEHLPANVRKNKEIKSFFEHLENSEFKGMSDEDLLILIRYAGYGVIDYNNVKLFAKSVKNLDDAKRLVKREQSAYPHFSEEYKKDKTIAEIAVNDTENIKKFPVELLNDSDFIQSLIEKYPFIAENIPASANRINSEISREFHWATNTFWNITKRQYKKNFKEKVSDTSSSEVDITEDDDVNNMDVRKVLATLSSQDFLDANSSEFLDEHSNLNRLRLLIEIQRLGNAGKSDDLATDTERFNQEGWLPQSDVDEENDYDEDEESENSDDDNNDED